MRSRDMALRLKRFTAEEKAAKVRDLESMIRDFDHMVADLDRQILAEEKRTGVADPSHFGYSTIAKSASTRRENLRTSLADLRAQLATAAREYEEARAELGKLEGADSGTQGGTNARRSA